MHSSLGRNAVFCALRFGKSVRELCSSRLSMFFSRLLSHLNHESVVAAKNAKEFILILAHRAQLATLSHHIHGLLSPPLSGCRFDLT
jgi:hypothetical protein